MPNTPLRHNCPICLEDCPNLSWFHPQRSGDARHGVCQGCNNRINQCPLCRQGHDAPSAPCKSKKRRRSPDGGGKKPRKLPTMPTLFGKRKIHTGKKGGKYIINKGKKKYLTKNKTKKSRFGSDTTQLDLPCYLRRFTREDWMSARVSEWVLRIRLIFRPGSRDSARKMDELQAEFGNNINFVKGYMQVLKAYSSRMVSETNLLRQENSRVASERNQLGRQNRANMTATPRRRSTPSPPRSPPRLSRSTRRMNRIGKTKRKIYTGKKGGKYVIRNGKKHYI